MCAISALIRPTNLLTPAGTWIGSSTPMLYWIAQATAWQPLHPALTATAAFCGVNTENARLTRLTCSATASVSQAL